MQNSKEFDKTEIKAFIRSSDRSIPMTACSLIMAHRKGMPLRPRHIEFLDESIQTAIATAEPEPIGVTNTPAQAAYKPTIQDRMNEKTSELIGDLEGKYDDMESVKFYDWLTANNVIQSQLSKYETLFSKRKAELELAHPVVQVLIVEHGVEVAVHLARLRYGAAQVGQGALSDPVEGESAVEWTERLEGHRPEQKQGHLVEVDLPQDRQPRPFRVQGSVTQTAGEVRKREAHRGADEQRYEPAQEPDAVRAHIPHQLQRLPDRLAIQRRLGQAITGQVGTGRSGTSHERGGDSRSREKTQAGREERASTRLEGLRTGRMVST